jgi:flagellar protein FliT
MRSSATKEKAMAVQLLNFYRAIEDSSAQMLDAAKVQDWDAVVRFEGVCAVLIAQLRSCARNASLDASARAEKAQIMQRILHNDAQIRDLTEPWLSEVDRQLFGKSWVH